MNISKAVIPCAGKGTRLNPYSTMMPKELFPLNCYPALYFIIKECIYCKISNICLIVSSEKKVIISQYVKKQFPRIKFQFFTQEVMNGTAKALLLIKKWIGEDPFLYMNPDSFYSSYEPTKKLLAEYKSHTLLSLFNGSDKDMSKYSVSEVKDNKNYTTAQVISKILEKPAIKATKSRVFSYWRAVISGKEIFAKLNKVRPDANGEFQLTTAFDMLAVEKKLFGLIVNKKIKVMDIGNKEGYAQANLFFTEENLH